jgi:uncharacterized protein YndB with AHSA1/START domain
LGLALPSHGAIEDSPPVGDLRLQQTHVLPAPRRRVYALFIEPEEVARWWGPDGFRIPQLDWNPRVGASYRIAMQPPEGELFHLSGEFREVDPPARLAFTFVWDPPSPDDRETLAELSFAAREDSTEVSLGQGPFATEERLSLHDDGWGQSFAKLRGRVTSERYRGRTRRQLR